MNDEVELRLRENIERIKTARDLLQAALDANDYTRQNQLERYLVMLHSENTELVAKSVGMDL